MKKELIVSLLLVLLVISISLIGVPIFRIEDEKNIVKLEQKCEPQPQESIKTIMKLPAINEDDEGIMAKLSVEVMPGKGRTLVNIDEILFWEDTQSSIRLAKSVAENITGMNLSDYDIIYSVQANASAIEGPSAGSAMAIATIASLKNYTINKSITMTGYLKSNGDIGRVSGIIPKAKIVKENGFDLFLVPEGQRYIVTYSKVKKCDNYIFTTFCRTETIENKTDIQKEVGIRIEEVGDVKEALGYFVID